MDIWGCINMENKKIKEFVKERYSKIATNEKDLPECSCGSTKENSIIKQAQAAGYTIREIKSIPSDAVVDLECGNSTALAEINPGEIVLYLGFGGA
jgi:arsenite methyltransferase